MRKAQYSVRRLRLRALLDAAPAVGERLGPFADLDSSWVLLARVERVAPDVVEDVLMHPSVGVWLSRALRQVLGTVTDATPLWSEVGWFHSVAAAVAVRSGLACDVVVPVVHGAVTLPSVGSYLLPHRFPVGHATLRTTPGGVVVEVAGRPAPVRREPVKRLRVAARGRAVEVVVDDLDPYREFTSPVPPAPLDGAEWDEWRKLLGEAWDLLTSRHAEAAEELSAGLSAVVPLAAGRDVFAASSAAAFGAIAMSPKRSATEFGEALVHELQHSKVNALLDLVHLHEDDTWPRFYAPWRDDPRPVDGLLHGIYAFVSVVEFWHVQRGRVPAPLTRRAEFSLALRAHQVGTAIAGLRGAAELTDLGRRFAAAVSVRLAACDTGDLPTDLVATVADLTAEHAATWRLRHVRPDDDAVAGAVDDWLARRPMSGAFGRGEVVPTAAAGDSLLAALLRLRALEPGEYDRLRPGRGPEHAHLRGDRQAAVDGWVTRLDAAPHDAATWAGLGLALGSTALRRAPELVRAVHRGVAARSGAPPPPVDLVTWFDRATG
ncbi:aKG-HExxH-type peptide beta-hydroxylase [Saccharothrix longispora]|uniref:aKG-HExxH-type peptide beta-hydroxylase n=1 Tax=Saccharothrix longispora TaxID=33920 RepID=UPI0028FD8AA3|nr:HEXXH motif-containing putative peptide modification protein [Saccharothrix longispora]MDU0289154.1 HEXXH motif-containing putative peptide modification protein [Saccharothrix longispora]